MKVIQRTDGDRYTLAAGRHRDMHGGGQSREYGVEIVDVDSNEHARREFFWLMQAATGTPREIADDHDPPRTVGRNLTRWLRLGLTNLKPEGCAGHSGLPRRNPPVNVTLVQRGTFGTALVTINQPHVVQPH